MASAVRRKRSTSPRTTKAKASTAQRSRTATFYLPPLYPYQRQLIEDTSRDVCTVSATQVGKSFAEACWLLAMAWQDRSRVNPWWWTGPTYNQVMNGHRYVSLIAGSAGIIATSVLTPFPKITLINGAVIEFRSRDNFEGLMGSTIAGGVVDEAGQMSPMEHSALSTRRSATMGPLHFIGNPGIVAGPFRRLCAEAESSGRGWHKWTWQDKQAALDTVRAKAYGEFIEEERRNLPEYEFRRLYEAEWTEDEAAVFRGVDQVSAGDPIAAPAPGERYAVGIDVGQQVDYLVAVGIGVKSRRADWMVRFRGIPYPQAAATIAQTMQKFPGLAIVESNGPGLGFYQELRRLRVTCGTFDTTTRSKDEIVMALAGALNPVAPKLTLANMAPLQHELKVFRYSRKQHGYSYSAPEGEHDDTVMALALANYALRRVGAAAWQVG